MNHFFAKSIIRFHYCGRNYRTGEAMFYAETEKHGVSRKHMFSISEIRDVSTRDSLNWNLKKMLLGMPHNSLQLV